MSEAQVLAFRRSKDEAFKLTAQSPLTPAQREVFEALSYYPYNAALDLTVTVTPFADEQTVQMQTTTGTVRDFERYGEFRFEADGETLRLTLYRADYGFFLPFADPESYSAGRYLEPDFLGGDRFHVDFNLAYNPFCVYSDQWTCPITPPENRLTVAIRAGEMLPQGHWLDR
jgi:uncharacterized protein (DUF1684 family)